MEDFEDSLLYNTVTLCVHRRCWNSLLLTYWTRPGWCFTEHWGTYVTESSSTCSTACLLFCCNRV